MKYRYAIGNAERPMLKSKIGWLDILANDTHEYYYPNNTGGPSIKVRFTYSNNVCQTCKIINMCFMCIYNCSWMCR